MVNVSKLLDSSLTSCFHALEEWMYIKIRTKLLAYNLSKTFSFAIIAIVTVNSYPVFGPNPVTSWKSPSQDAQVVIRSLDVKDGGSVCSNFQPNCNEMIAIQIYFDLITKIVETASFPHFPFSNHNQSLDFVVFFSSTNTINDGNKLQQLYTTKSLNFSFTWPSFAVPRIFAHRKFPINKLHFRTLTILS